mmetsp:Transcript_40330/g.84708  ORF Transcript_40330/g.84708 Transcript_40330/m.84708 type:complete len:299 (+) Transcript_40330:197-1093(+)
MYCMCCSIILSQPSRFQIKRTFHSHTKTSSGRSIIVTTLIHKHEKGILAIATIVRNGRSIQCHKERIPRSQWLKITILHGFVYHPRWEVWIFGVARPTDFPVQSLPIMQRRSRSIAWYSTLWIDFSKPFQNIGCCVRGLLLLCPEKFCVSTMQKFQQRMQCRLRLLYNIMAENPLRSGSYLNGKIMSPTGWQMSSIEPFGCRKKHTVHVVVSVLCFAFVENVCRRSGHESVSLRDNDGDSHVRGRCVKINDDIRRGILYYVGRCRISWMYLFSQYRFDFFGAHCLVGGDFSVFWTWFF